jgi:hypothetical protein
MIAKESQHESADHDQLKGKKVGTTFEDVKRAFRDMVKRIQCPSCGLEFTDAAVDWGEAWSEGRRDSLVELEMQDRDGPYKVKCELCETRSFINYFSFTASTVERSK